MALNRSTLLIRDYENIRQILRDIYIFGCFSRDDFIEKKGICGRKYDKEQKRISAYLPDKFICKRRVNKKVLLYCSYNTVYSAENYLADTYRNKSFSALDIMSYFFVQQLLNEKEEMTAAEILTELPSINEEVMFTKENLRVKLDELLGKGFIKNRKKGRKVLYSLCDDIWADFGDDELLDILTYLEFMKNVSPMEIPYYFLHQKLRLYLKCEREIKINNVKVFQFKHNHLFNLLDNDVLLEVLRSKKQNKLLRIRFYGNGSDAAIEIDVIPGEIIHDSTYGRQYLYCIDIAENLQRVVRIDRIGSAQCGRSLDASEKQRAEKISTYSKDCWCTSGIDQKMTESIIEFRFDEDKESFILRRLLKEGHGGELQKTNQGVYEFRISLKDPDEMIPWIRSFGERAKVISSGNKHTKDKLAEDWKKAVKKYESL